MTGDPRGQAATWRQVERDLTRLLDAARDRWSRRDVAPVHFRRAVVRLKRGVLDAHGPLSLASGDSLDALGPALLRQLEGRPVDRPVLPAVRPAVRAEAAAILHQAIQVDPRHRPSLRGAAVLASVAGRWAEAATWLERLAESYAGQPTGAAVWMEAGDVQWQKLGRHDEARAAFEAALSGGHDEQAVLDRLLKLALEAERWSDAVALCGRLIERAVQLGAPQAGVTYRLTLGEISLHGRRSPAEALLHYLLAARDCRDFALTYTLLGELLRAHPWRALSGQLAALDAVLLVPVSEDLDALRAGAARGLEGDALVAVLPGAPGQPGPAALRSGSGSPA